MPLGAAVMALALASGDFYGCSNIGCNGDDDYWIVILLIMLSEGVSFHVPILEILTFSPYVNPFGVDYLYVPRLNKAPFLATLSTGLKINMFFDKFNFAPYFDYRTIYGYGKIGFGAGMTLNVILD